MSENVPDGIRIEQQDGPSIRAENCRIITWTPGWLDEAERWRVLADAAMIRRALYRVGIATPHSREPIEDWIAEDSPDWVWPTFEEHHVLPEWVNG